MSKIKNFDHGIFFPFADYKPDMALMIVTNVLMVAAGIIAALAGFAVMQQLIFPT